MHSWRPTVALQMWARDPCPLFARKMRQPYICPLPPVRTKRVVYGLHSPAAPTLCQQSVHERSRRPSKAALHSPNVVCGLHRENVRCLPRALRARRAKVWQVASSGNYAHTTKPVAGTVAHLRRSSWPGPVPFQLAHARRSTCALPRQPNLTGERQGAHGALAPHPPIFPRARRARGHGTWTLVRKAPAPSP